MMTTMMTIRYCDIPVYLRKGEFFRKLSEDDPQGTIEIPADCLAEDFFVPGGVNLDQLKVRATMSHMNDVPVVRNIEQFRKQLKMMMFWVLDEIPSGAVHFCCENDIAIWRAVVLSLPGGDKSSLVRGLLTVFSEKNVVKFDEALHFGDWNVIACCIDVINPNKVDATCTVAKYGNLRALKLLHEKGFAWDENTCAIASHHGHLECLRFLHETGCPWDVMVYDAALTNGHLNCIQYAHQQGLKWHENMCFGASRRGYLDCLQYAHQNGCTWNIDVYTEALFDGHLHIIKYAHEQGLAWDHTSCQDAAYNGQLQCLQYLLEQGCPADKVACIAAAQKGHLNCLQLLHLYNVPWDAETCKNAVVCPNITCLQYLHENGCPWDNLTPTTATALGNTDALRYALDNGCEYADNLMITAVQSTNIECIQYLLEVQGLYMHETGELFLLSLLKGNLQCLQYLIDQGCPYYNIRFSAINAETAAYDKFFTKNNPQFVQCLQFAVERGWCIDKNCIDYLVSRDWDNCKEYLIQEEYLVFIKSV